MQDETQTPPAPFVVACEDGRRFTASVFRGGAMFSSEDDCYHGEDAFLPAAHVPALISWLQGAYGGWKPGPQVSPPASGDYPWPHHSRCQFIASSGQGWCDCHEPPSSPVGMTDGERKRPDWRKRAADAIGCGIEEVDEDPRLAEITARCYRGGGTPAAVERTRLGPLQFDTCEPNGVIGVFVGDDDRPRGVGDTATEALEDFARRHSAPLPCRWERATNHPERLDPAQVHPLMIPAPPDIVATLSSAPSRFVQVEDSDV